MYMNSLLNNIKTISLQHPNINDFYSGDVYDLNGIDSLKYPLIFVELNNISSDLNDMNNNFRIYYIDRLLNDNSNQLEIQIDSGYILNEIVEVISNYYSLQTPFTIEVFREKFNDNCAGGFVDIIIRDSICGSLNIEIDISVPIYSGLWEKESINTIKPKNEYLIDAKYITNLPDVDISTFELELSRKNMLNSYIEMEVDISGNTNMINYWTDSGKTIKLFEKEIIYDINNNPYEITNIDLLNNKILTTNIQYDINNNIISISKIES